MPYVSDGTSWHSTATAWSTATAVWEALTHDPAPPVTVHANSGTGATATYVGNRLQGTLAVTTGSTDGLVSGGILATLTPVGYTNAPYVGISSCDEVSAAVFAFVKNPTNSSVPIAVAGELEPGTTYTFNLVFQGA